MSVAHSVGCIRGRAAARLPGGKSELEATLALHMRADSLPVARTQYRFLSNRKFAFDFAWPALMFAVEVDGHVHRIRERFDSDREKGTLALLAGWSVMHVTGKHIRAGEAIAWITEYLKRKGAM